MTRSTTIATAALVLCATALQASGWQPSRVPLSSPDNNVRLSLHQQFGRAMFRECRLDIVTYENAGNASLRCERNVAPPTVLLRQRKLTSDEAGRLVRFVHASHLLAGDYIGLDETPGDGVFETLRITVSSGTGVLVTSGNPSFTTGARRELLDWLQRLMRALQESPE